MSVLVTSGATSSARVRAAKWALSSALLAIVLKLWTMQVLHYDFWSEESRQTLTRNSSLPAPRGVIYDREGHVLAGNEPLWAVVVTLDDVEGYDDPPWLLDGRCIPEAPVSQGASAAPEDGGKPKYSPPPEALVRASQILCDIINADPQRQGPDPIKPPLDWRERLNHLAQYNYAAWRPAPFADDLDHNVVMRIMERLPELRGVEVVRRFRRDYEHPFEANCFHLVGYVQRITYERRHLLEPEYGYEMTDSVGMTGVESRYEKILRGAKGREVIGIEGTPKVDRPAEPGLSLSLTIDAKLQAAMEQSLREYVERLGAPGGAAIAMDPQSGEVYALASYPAFQSEWFAPDASPEERAAYTQAEKDMGARGAWNNQAIAYQRAPASAFKFVTLTAALEEGEIDAQTYTAYCSGKMMLGSSPKLCWQKAGHGSVGVTRSLAVSCNVFYYGLGVKLGEEKLVRWARNFGFGEPTGIDLPDEEPGIVGDRTYLINVKNESGWYAGDSANFAIGQGSITATPIQVAVATSVIANGGRRVVPHVVGRVTRAGKPQPPITQQRDPVTVPIRPTTLDLVRKGMRAVVAWDQGTAFHAFSGEGWIPRVPVAGKTGSSEIDSDDAWFTCYAPYVDMNPSNPDSVARSNAAPKLVVTVLIVNGGHGGDAAAPVARDVVAAAFDDGGQFLVRPSVAH